MGKNHRRITSYIYMYQKEIMKQLVEIGMNNNVSEMVRGAIKDYVIDILNERQKFSRFEMSKIFSDYQGKDKIRYSLYLRCDYIEYFDLRKLNGDVSRGEQIRNAIDYYLINQMYDNLLLNQNLIELKKKVGKMDFMPISPIIIKKLVK